MALTFGPKSNQRQPDNDGLSVHIFRRHFWCKRLSGAALRQNIHKNEHRANTGSTVMHSQFRKPCCHYNYCSMKLLPQPTHRMHDNARVVPVCTPSKKVTYAKRCLPCLSGSFTVVCATRPSRDMPTSSINAFTRPEMSGRIARQQRFSGAGCLSYLELNTPEERCPGQGFSHGDKRKRVASAKDMLQIRHGRAKAAEFPTDPLFP